MADLAAVRSAFVAPGEFWSSPLYQELCPLVAADPFLLDVAASARACQVPSYAFFGAVHAILLSGVTHELGQYFQSVQDDRARLPDQRLGLALIGFVRENEQELREILRTRLVQTNHVQRSVGLRLGLALIADHLDSPAHLLEIGCSAGLVLRHEHYGYQLGGQHFGRTDSPVQLRTEWRSSNPVPDLDRVPAITSTTGIDLNPLDPTSESDRRWLEALVWPEDRGKAALLRRSLAIAAQIPVRTVTGDAIDRCPRWSDRLPDGQARIVFHCATRMHVPPSRRAAFDAAVEAAGTTAPLFRIAIEGAGLLVTGPDGNLLGGYDVDGHLAWAAEISLEKSG